MTLHQHSTTVHVIGGGVAGLAAAAFVARAGRPVVVHEHRGRCGGRATTDERDGFRFNQGPHAFYVGGEAAGVLAELGIRPTGDAPASRGARMVHRGVGHVAPGGASSLVATRLLGLRDKADLARLLTRLDKVRPSDVAANTAEAWVAQLTDREAVAAIVHALIRLSTYVNAPGQLSADVAAQQIQRALSTGVIYLDGGWETLVDQLTAAVLAGGGQIVPGDAVTVLPDAPAVIVAAGGPEAARNLTGHEFVHGPAAEASVLDLSLVSPARHRFVIGVDEAMYLSDHGTPRRMTPSGRASVSLAQYLAPGDEPGSRPDRERLRAFADHGGITADQILHERYLHRMTTVTAIPTAAAGGLAGRADVVVPGRAGVFVAGDWVGARGHLLDAALSSAKASATAAVRHLDRKVTV